jgi:hypothetical protein
MAFGGRKTEMKNFFRSIVFGMAALSPLIVHAESNPTPPVVPPASACATGALNYGMIVSYLNNANVYKSTVLAPKIVKATSYTAFASALADELGLDYDELSFLNSCHLSASPSCQPGTEVLAQTTTEEISSKIIALDSDQGLSSIQGFFRVPSSSANFDPTVAIHNYYTITLSAYCTLHPYIVHPDVVTNLEPPTFK